MQKRMVQNLLVLRLSRKHKDDKIAILILYFCDIVEQMVQRFDINLKQLNIFIH
jgi:hypothetical protein